MRLLKCLRQYNFDRKGRRTYFFDFTIFVGPLLFGGNAGADLWRDRNSEDAPAFYSCLKFVSSEFP
jgi:hypothetical protein